MEVCWLTSAPASAWHATVAILGGRNLVDQRLAEALAEPVADLAARLDVHDISQAHFFDHLIPLSVAGTAVQGRVETAIGKLLGRQSNHALTAELASLVIAVEHAFLRVYPNAADELALRAEPLRGRWEARGPGLLAMLRRLTVPELLVERADVVLVQPVLGGGGAAHWLYNSVRLEAVLANPVAEVPEVLRLGWLLAQLNLDLPVLHGELHRDRWLVIGPLALVPAILAAGQEVELCRTDPATLARALEVWQLESISADVLADWWESYHTSRPNWSVALAALDQLVESSRFT